ncbi:hypothetical protein, variant [Capsaspora owczarzaki ATCC 30864]|nr:hypothetical protein, variant [Capsaspora owczarzaki ATCC 30864]|eukprot:XP_011270891.1 hypothetical protein, variant [Capsaspora owczarzaki ATCC 30864]
MIQLGQALLVGQRLNDGEAILTQALDEARKAAESEPDALRPASAGGKLMATIHHSLGKVSYLKGQHQEALGHFRNATLLDPANAEHSLLLASIQASYGDKKSALEIYKRAILLNPKSVLALTNAAQLALELGDAKSAYDYALRSVKIDRTNTLGFINLGAALRRLQKHKASSEAFDKALLSNSTNVHAIGESIIAKMFLADHDAVEQRLPELRTLLLQQIRHTLDALENRAITGSDQTQKALQQLAVPPFNLMYFDIVPEILRDYSAAFAAIESRNTQAIRYKLAAARIDDLHSLSPSARSALSQQRIHVGIISADFYNHPTSHLLYFVLSQLNKDRFHVTGYSTSPYEDAWTEKMRSVLNGGVVSVHAMSPAEATARIVADKTDILLDMMGYSSGARPDIIACKPAPIVASYLTYCGTSGSTEVDYTLCDRTTCPSKLVPSFLIERVVTLPTGLYPPAWFRASEVYPPAPEDVVAKKTELGLPNDGAFTFCSLGPIFKANKSTVHSWIRILKQAPEARLWVIAHPNDAAANFRRLVAEAQVEAQVILTPRLEREDFLEYAPSMCDLFLDTLPYNAHTTASEMLTGGLPVLTQAGQTRCGRSAAGMLSSASLDQFIATSAGLYEAMAVEFATTDAGRAKVLAARRSLLAGRTALAQSLTRDADELSPDAFDDVPRFFNVPQHARGLEAAFETMQSRYLRGLKPIDFEVTESDLQDAEEKAHQAKHASTSDDRTATARSEL